MDIFLLNDIIVFLFIEIILVGLMIISEYSVIKILRKWDFSVTTSLQYNLEKRNYLVNTIINFTIVSKIILFIYFVKALDELRHVVPGAMCVAGVIGANDYGNILLLFKIFIVFLLAVWLIINRLDLQSKRFLYIKNKYILFNFLLVLVVIELVLELLFFNDIPLKVPVFCCSTMFKFDQIPFDLEMPYLVALFYICFFAIIIVNYLKKIVISFLLNISFLFISYYAVTYFFGIYVYVLPNHQCPFCLLQKEYYFVGYFIWISLFLGVFFGVCGYVVESIIKIKDVSYFKYSSIFNFIFVMICSYYVICYYIENGVFL